MLIDLVIVRLVEIMYHVRQTRIDGFSDIISNMDFVIHNMGDILTYTCNLFPKYGLYLFIFLVFCAGAMYVGKNEIRRLVILKMILITVVTIASSFLIFLMTTSSWGSGRLHFAIGSLIGILFIYLYCNTKIFKKRQASNYFATTVLGIYLVINLYNYVFLIDQHKQVNALERKLMQQIDNEITAYEEKNNISVKKIAIILIPGYTNRTYFDEVNTRAVLTCNAFRSDWAAVGIVNFYTGRNLEKVYLTQETKDYYLERQNSEDETTKGYMCIGDTFVVSIYMR